MSELPNPAAFPPHGASFDYEGVQTGMTLRDWFAGQALVGVIPTCAGDMPGDGETVPQSLARKAFDVADAMLAARAAPRSKGEGE